MTPGNRRPRSIAEIAHRALADHDAFDPAVLEFVDQWQVMQPADRRGSIAAEPAKIDLVRDAYLGALAEHLARGDHIPVPAWTGEPGRFLTEPFFAGGLESLKATLIVESPAAFRRRLIFISADALSRPPREFIQENALSVANLDV